MEGRQLYEPISKNFGHGNKRASNWPENKKVYLPKHVDNFNECVMEMIEEKISKHVEST